MLLEVFKFSVTSVFVGGAVLIYNSQRELTHIVETNEVNDDFYSDLDGGVVLVRGGRGIGRYISDVKKYISDLDQTRVARSF